MIRIKIIPGLMLFSALTLALTSCGNLEKEVEVELPAFKSQLVVEAYLEKNEPVRVAVMESKDYFSEAEPPFINDATVIVTYGTQTDTLKLNPNIDLQNFKYFNYHLTSVDDTLPLKPGDLVQVQIRDKNGRVATAETRWIDPVPLDSVTHQFNSDGKAFVLAHFHDPAGNDFYRFRARKLYDTTNSFIPDYFSGDDIFEGQKSSFGTEYRYEKGDTVEVTLYTLTQEYYDFLTTANAASSANGNPFAQPAAIKSNIKGGTGIFTVLPYDRLLYVIP